MTIKEAVTKNLIKIGSIVKHKRFNCSFIIKSIIVNEKSDYNNGLLCEYSDENTRIKMKEWGMIGLFINFYDEYLPIKLQQLSLF